MIYSSILNNFNAEKSKVEPHKKIKYDDRMKKHMLVTGGAGFIGSHLVEELLDQNYSVVVLDNFSTGKKENIPVHPELSVITGDIRDDNLLEHVFQNYKIDTVFHLAAMASVPVSVAHPVECHDINTFATVKLLEHCKSNSVRRFILASTAAVYGDEPTMPKTETSTLRLLSPYATSKLSAEHDVILFSHLYNLETVVLRFFNIYGPRQDITSSYAGVIPRFTATLLEGKQPQIFGDGGQTRDFVYVKDVARANVFVMQAPKEQVIGQVFNIATGVTHTLNDFFTHVVKTITDQTGQPPSFTTAQHETVRLGDIRHSCGSSEKIQALGFEFKTKLHDGLEHTVAYYNSVIKAS